MLFFGIATYSFIHIIQLAGGKQRQIIAGALVWLSAQYMIGGVLEMLMRDEGFWAFYLLSIVFFMRFYQQHRTKDALLWQVCIIAATLFRIEAILFLMFLPLILFFQAGFSVHQKWRNFFQTNSIHLILAILIIGVFALNDNLSTKLLGRLNEVFTTNLWQQFTKIFSEKSTIMSSQVLGEYLEEYATQGLLMTFIYVMLTKSITATGVINIGLGALALKHNKVLIENSAFQVLRAAAMIALLNMALIMVKVFVLSSRYVLALSFILMVFAAFYLAEILFGKPVLKNQKHQGWLAIALVIFMLSGAIKNLLPKKAGYNYQQEAVAWVQANNKENKPVFYDEPRMRYYANASFVMPWPDNWLNTLTLLNNKQIEKYDYVLINFSASEAKHKLYVEKKLLSYNNVMNFYDAKEKKHSAIYIKSN